MHHPTDRIAHTTAFVTPVVVHWLEREIAQWVHPMNDRSDDPLHHERTLLPRSYISLQEFVSYRTRLAPLRWASPRGRRGRGGGRGRSSSAPCRRWCCWGADPAPPASACRARRCCSRNWPLVCRPPTDRLWNSGNSCPGCTPARLLAVPQAVEESGSGESEIKYHLLYDALIAIWHCTDRLATGSGESEIKYHLLYDALTAIWHCTNRLATGSGESEIKYHLLYDALTAICHCTNRLATGWGESERKYHLFYNALTVIWHCTDRLETGSGESEIKYHLFYDALIVIWHCTDRLATTQWWLALTAKAMRF